MRNRKSLIGMIIPLIVGWWASSTVAVVYQVNNTSDNVSTTGSLRWVMDQANNVTNGPDRIEFATGFVNQTIEISSILQITDRVEIDGEGHRILIRNSTVGGIGLRFDAGSAGSTLNGLALTKGIPIHCDVGNMTGHNIIRKCKIGVDWDNNDAGGTTTGIRIHSQGNLIQGNTLAAYTTYGIELRSTAQYCRIQGNVIGGDTGFAIHPAGTAWGVSINGGGNHLIGGDRFLGEGNIIGYQDTGIYIIFSSGNTLVGNTIGMAGDQTQPCPNTIGVALWTGADNNDIGRNLGPAYRNVMVGNRAHDLELGNCSWNRVRNNLIGLSATNWIDTAASPSKDQIMISSVTDLTIGGTSPGDRNFIYCGGKGLWFAGGVQRTQVVGNWFGMAPNGNPMWPASGGQAIQIENLGCTDNSIGLFGTGQGNLIYGGQRGIYFTGSGSDQNGMFGNTIVAFSGKGIDQDLGGNLQYAPPTITFSDTAVVRGTALGGDRIEVFQAEPRPGLAGGSLKFLGSTTVAAGVNWQLALTGVQAGDWVCATASDTANNTSEFSLNLQVQAGPVISPTVPPSAITDHLLIYPNLIHASQGGSLNLTVVLPSPQPAELAIYTRSGQKVADLLKGEIVSGAKTLKWDPGKTAAGIYLVVLKYDDQVVRKKLCIVR